MIKSLRVTMPDGSQWDIPVDAIVRHRAECDVEEGFCPTLREAIDHCVEWFETNPRLLTDWAQNNMNWADVKAHAVRVMPRSQPTMTTGGSERSLKRYIGRR